MVVWLLYIVGISALLTPFIGIFMAYYGRKHTDDAHDFTQYQKQIRYFWNSAKGWAIGTVILAIGIVMDTASGFSGDEPPTLFYVGILVMLLTSVVFTLASLWGLIRSFSRKTPDGALFA